MLLAAGCWLLLAACTLISFFNATELLRLARSPPSLASSFSCNESASPPSSP